MIVGFGIAGATLARTLTRDGYKVCVINYEDPNSSSLVSAGLVNPITGRNFSLTWRADEVIPYMTDYYRALESDHGETLFNAMPIYRVCSSIREQNEWSAKAGQEHYRPFIMEGIDPDPAIIDAPFGTIGTARGGYINIALYIDLMKKELGPHYTAVSEPIGPDDIRMGNEKVQWGDLAADHLVLCEGYMASQNQLFGYLPFTPMKGEILELDIPGMYNDSIWIRGGFVVPVHNGTFLAGATYDWRNTDKRLTEEAKRDILERVAGYIRVPLEVSGHRAGIRPAVKDRKPLIGTHPLHRNVHLFNGMGSKGASISPFLAKLFVRFIRDGEALPAEVDLDRFPAP